MIISAGTFTHVLPNHNPNDGRNIINANFDLIENIATSTFSGVTSGNTIVFAGDNISIVSGYTIGSGTSPYYTVSVASSPVFVTMSAGTILAQGISGNSISADTFYSGSTNLGDLFLSLLPTGGSSYAADTTVSASSVDNYIGVGTPTVTGYSISTIYLTQFANSNTITATTLNIDGLGTINLLKGTDEGLASLDVGEIQTGITYYLTYDGDQFQFFTSSPVGTTTTYTNLNPSTVAVGGVPVGTTFSAATWQGIFDTMFYPSLTPTFTAFALRTTAASGSSVQPTSLEVGNSVSGGSKAFTWTTSNSAYVSPNSIKIYSGASLQISTPTGGMANDSFEAITLTNTRRTSPGSYFWKIVGTRTTSSTFNSTYTVNWYWKRMYGVSTATTITTSDGVNAFSGLSALTTVTTGAYSFTGSGYKYFFTPTTFASPTLFKDTATNLSIAMADSSDDAFFSGVSGSYYYGTTSVTNQYGIAQNYRVYRTRNYLYGNIAITVT